MKNQYRGGDYVKRGGGGGLDSLQIQRHIDRNLKNGATKSIVHVIKHTNFQPYRVQPDEII